MFEIRQRISEPALTTHDGCGGAVRRLLSPAPFILKGDGWYVTDYPSDARKKAMEGEKGAKTETKSETTAATDAAKPATSTTTTSAGASTSSSSTT